MPTHSVERIGDDAKVRQQILDVGGFNELYPAAFDKGQSASGQLNFQIERVKTGTEQDRHLAQWHSLFTQFQNFLGHEPRLGIFSSRFSQRRQGTIKLPREQVLGIFLSRFFDDAVGEVQNRLSASIIFLQFID